MLKQLATVFLVIVAAPIVTGQVQRQNRLASESSPYLLQHANNPVDWYPWGDAAIAKAKSEGKLIFLSIGYSACHWCHVMERESFSDDEIAAFMNANFVCIKVDREQRPDVDQIYMTAVQVVGGNAGWPLSVFLTPDTKPISGGAYFPPRDGDRGFPEGFLSILKRLSAAWRDQKIEVNAHADRVTQALLASLKRADDKTSEQRASMLQQSIATETLQKLNEQFDTEFGGFGSSALTPNRPKFPEPSNLYFLLDCAKRDSLSKDQRSSALQMLSQTLDGMYTGGIYDHIGGGFHRYSTDPYWRVPHFEKMLYDNAQLAAVYAKAFELTGREDYRWVAEDICNFVIADLSSPQGAFYSSINADSEDSEGAFYLWKEAELNNLRDKDEGLRMYTTVLGLKENPNFENHSYIPQPRKILTSIAQEQNTSIASLIDNMSLPRAKMKSMRDQRAKPTIDNKIIASWNGLMIGALADCGRILKRSDFIQAASRAAEFVVGKMRTEEGLLCRTYAADGPQLKGYLDDYANVVYGLCRLHEATGERQWLDEALSLNDRQASIFEDTESGGYFYTSLDHPNLIVRFKDPVDGAMPSGNSVTAANLLYLSRHTDENNYKQSLRKLLESEAVLMSDSPSACPLLVMQLQEWLFSTAAAR